MLTDVALRPRGSDPLIDVLAGGRNTTRIEQGIYECGHFNFVFEFRRQDFDLDYPGFEDPEFNCYGVCDSLENLKEHLPKEVTEGPEAYVISLVKVAKKDQSPEGGWRWHKWGPYIGKQKPQCEYLYDEPSIDEVYCYHVYLVGV